MRVCTRSRHRRAWPWVFKTKVATSTPLASEVGRFALPMQAVAELMFRAERLSFHCEFALVDSDEELNNYSGSGTGEIEQSSFVESELDRSLAFAQGSGEHAGDIYYLTGSGQGEFIWDEDGDPPTPHPFILGFSIFPLDPGAVHGDDLYLLRIIGEIGAGDGISVYSVEPTVIPGEVSSPITIKITLASGSFSFPAWAVFPDNYDLASFSLEITANKWLAYSTKNGADAWDTDTGLPINGGPGA